MLVRSGIARFAAALIAAQLTAPAAVGQVRGQFQKYPEAPRERLLRSHGKRSLKDSFDIRRTSRAASLKTSAAEEENRQKVLVDQRRRFAGSAADQLAAASGGRIRLTFNDFGLPGTLLSEGMGLSAASAEEPVEIAKQFLKAQRAVFPFTDSEIEHLRLSGDTASGGARFLTFHQTLNGIPVYHGLVRVAVERTGRVVQAGAGEVVPGLGLDTRPALSPAQSVDRALRLLGVKQPPPLVRLGDRGDQRTYFANPLGDHYAPVAAELSIFPMTAASGRLAYRIFVEKDRQRWYEMLVDANDGALLLRLNLHHSAAKANVWTESPLKGPRELVDLPQEWLPAGGVVTKGNNVDAYLDTIGNDKPDPWPLANMLGGRAYALDQVFSFPAGDGTTNQDPMDFPAASVTNLFYFVNVAHDYFYRLGFDEAAGNFQLDNFGRGGKGGDPVLAEAQDPEAGVGDFVTQPDGMPSRLEVGIIPGDSYLATDDYDASYDGQVVLHEYAHGVADRLVGGPDETSCLLPTLQGAALGEGWADYFAISFFNTPVMGAYAGRNGATGVRRQSYEGYTFTFEDLGNQGFESHNDGEIWAAALWDLRKALGQSTVDRLAVDALKGLACDPTMIDARDAILAADKAVSTSANRVKIWETFARHGMGYSAGALNGSPGELMIFNAAFDLPPDLATGNRNPAVTSEPPDSAIFGDTFVYTVRGADDDGDALRYDLTEAPDGMTIDPATGRLQWQAGFTGQRVKVTITDGRGGKVVHGFYLPVVAFLSAGAPITVSGKQDSMGRALIKAPPAGQALQVSLAGGGGDPDLALQDPASELYGWSMNEGSEETLSVSSPAAGYWTVWVAGYADYTGVSLLGNFPVPEALPPAGKKENLSGGKTSETFYKFLVPAGARKLLVTTSGGTGDVDLYVRRGQVGVCSSNYAPCDVDDGSFNEGNEESIEVDGVEAGDWFITLNGYTAYNGVTLTATVLGPAFSSDGMVNSGSFTKVLSPGGIFSIFGDGFASAEFTASAIPLPASLGGVSVMVNATQAPLYYVGPRQINAQMPYEVKPGEATVQVVSGEVAGSSGKVAVGVTGPGIFQYGTNRAVVQNQDGSLNEAGKPAAAGTIITVYLTGLGPVDNPVATGAAAARSPLSKSTSTYGATIGGREATVEWLGLVPDLVGLAQANVRVPALAAGEYPLQVTVGGVASNTATVSVSEN